jgi:hypothetical protein
MTSTLFPPSLDLCLTLGALLFCAGTLLGIPHGLSKGRGDAKRIELWRIAHLSTCVGGVSLIALTLALDKLFGGVAVYCLLLFSLAAYSFFLACTLSGCLNKSWDDDRTQTSVMLIYMLQIFASVASVLGVCAFLATLILKFIP